MKVFGDLLTMLAETRETVGTLLDHTQILSMEVV